MKIFWSWQSDTPEHIGRNFVRDALQDAITAIQGEIAVDEPDRDELHLDHDRKGVPGSPDLADIILQKIRESSVFVADVTPVGRTPEGKPLINSNVAIELGYALPGIGNEGFLMVLNQFYGNRDTLPFDLRHKYGPIIYELSPEAFPDDIGRVKRKLTADLKDALMECIDAKRKGSVKTPPAHDEIPSKSTIAQYFEAGAVLAQRTLDEEECEFVYETNSFLYLRVIPTKMMPKLRQAEISDLIYGIKIRPLRDGRGGGAMHERNPYGGMTFSSNDKGKLLTSTQIFPNREIWGIDGTILSGEKKYIPSFAFEMVIESGLRHYLEFGQKYLKLECPLIIEAGSSDVAGFKMAMGDQYMDRYWGPIMNPDIRSRHDLRDFTKKAIDGVLLKIFEDFFDAVGVKRPEHFRNFPPEPANDKSDRS